MKGARWDSQRRPPLPFRRPNSWRDNIEGILSALVLVLIIRHFVFEVFKIPTGSMAPTLVGQHERVSCPNCGLEFDIDVREGEYVREDGSGGMAHKIERHRSRCVNCGYEFEARKEPVEVPRLPAKRILFELTHGIAPGNRVIVNKFAAQLGPPKRWSVVVFIQPEKQLNYIKRLVGLPGEEITIRHGDLFANGRLLRKPESIQNEVWRLVYDSRVIPEEDLQPAWKAVKGEFRRVRGGLSLAPAADGQGGVEYFPAINDRILYNDYVPSLDYRSVGDLKWEVEATLDRPGLLLLHIQEDEEYYSAAISFGASGAPTALLRGAAVLRESGFCARPGRSYRFAFSNVDDRLALAVDGRRILEAGVPVAPADVPKEARENGALIEVRGGIAHFSRVRLYRDLYYIPYNGARTFFVDRKGYFVLGDNMQNSADSRLWGCYPEENFIGNAALAALVWWPPGYPRPIPYE